MVGGSVLLPGAVADGAVVRRQRSRARRAVGVLDHHGFRRRVHGRVLVDLFIIYEYILLGWLGSRVVSVLDSGAEGSGFKSQSRRCRVTVLGKLLTPTVPLFTKQQNL